MPKLDQHFLENEEVSSLFAALADIKEEDSLIELGPGKGALTKRLLEKNPASFVVLEQDKDLAQELSDKYPTLQVLCGNGLTFLQEENLHCTKLVSAIPYSLTEPLYALVLDKKIPFCLFLQGRNFYKNHLCNEKSKWFHFVRASYDIEEKAIVKGNSFSPPTKVSSSLLTLKLKPEQSTNEKFLAELFSRRKRSCLNALLFSLVETLKISKKEAKKIITDLNLPPKIISKKLAAFSNEEFFTLKEKIPPLETENNK